MSLPAVIIIDDQPEDLAAVQKALAGQPYRVLAFSSPMKALEQITANGADVLLTALNMPEMDGFRILRAVKESAPGCKTIIFAGYGRVEDAVRAIKSGASDFLTKPLNTAAIPEMVGQLITLKRPVAEALETPSNRVKCGLKLRPVYDTAVAAAKTNFTVLLNGETGVGKEVFANVIHENSLRSAQQYVKINCAALSESLIESELFGHEQGAFTGAGKRNVGRFERADKGTLFLDEIGELSHAMQTKLLRVLESREIERVGGDRSIKVDFRLICATHRDLQQMVAEGKFRQDLYYRVNKIPIYIPPLRERKDEIAELSAFFLARARASMQRGPTKLDPQAVEFLQGYKWPGNIRELENTIERACLLAQDGSLHVSDLWWLDSDRSTPKTVAPADDLSVLDSAQRVALKQVLDRHMWNFTRAATSLNISRSTLYIKARKYGLVRNNAQAQMDENVSETK
jgi:DNA-binding NtrC family response regulator